jgi:hypothetical protein
MFINIKRLPYIYQQMRKKEYDISSNEKIFNEKSLYDKPKNPAVYVFQRAQGDYTLVSKHKFQKFQYILHHTCTTTTNSNTCHTKKSCEHFFNNNTIKSNLYYDICSGIENSQSKLSCFIKFSKNPNCFLVKKYINKELNLGLYALRDIYEGDELSICNNIDNLFEIFNEFNLLLFPKELNPFKINFLRSLYLEKLIEKLNINDLDNFELKSLDISLEERNYLNNQPNLVSITQSLEYSILSHFSTSNLYPSKLLNSLKSKNISNRITLVSLTKTTLKLFNLTNDYYSQIYLILSLEHFNVTLSQKLSMLLNTYRLFLLWINCEHKFTYASRIELFIICYVISINSLMESWISINDWAKLLMSIGVSIGNCEKDVSEEVKYENFIERFKWLQSRCLECVEFKCMVTLCAYYNFLNKICDKFKINKLI